VRIFHIATATDWAAAQASGSYTTSTRGVSVLDEGFIHASREDQWEGVRDRYYADAAEPLVLLAIDTDLLDVPVVEEEVPGGETFPHVYGAIRFLEGPYATFQIVRAGSAPGDDVLGQMTALVKSWSRL